MSNYQSMVERIKKAQSIDDLNRLDKSLDRLYTSGIFGPNEVKALDLLIVDRKIDLEL